MTLEFFRKELSNYIKHMKIQELDEELIDIYDSFLTRDGKWWKHTASSVAHNESMGMITRFRWSDYEGDYAPEALDSNTHYHQMVDLAGASPDTLMKNVLTSASGEISEFIVYY